MGNLLTMDLAAIYAQVSVSTIHRYAQNGMLSIAKRGACRRLYFESAEIDRWKVWFKEHQEKVRERKRRRASALAKVNGMMLSGQLPCEEQDESDRDRLFKAAKGLDKAVARQALTELYQKYNGLRLPLEEQRVGITF